MRADRLVSLVLLLRRHGKLSASELAKELEVSKRTILRDVEALASTGVPIYADRGRNGGFALLSGYKTDLTGLSHDEALALLVAGSRSGGQIFGLGEALSAAMRKIIDAMPAGNRSVATGAIQRLLVDPETDLLDRPLVEEGVPLHVMAAVRDAVLRGRQLRIQYAAVGRPASWRTVNPVGLVAVRERGYLLAIRSGEDRTYRLARIADAAILDSPAERPEGVDLVQEWKERSAQLHSGDVPICLTLRLPATAREKIAGQAQIIESETVGADGETITLQARYASDEHAEWCLWTLLPDVEILEPRELRIAMYHRAVATARVHAPPRSSLR